MHHISRLLSEDIYYACIVFLLCGLCDEICLYLHECKPPVLVGRLWTVL